MLNKVLCREHLLLVIAFTELVLQTDYLSMVYDETKTKLIYSDYCLIMVVFSSVR